MSAAFTMKEMYTGSVLAPHSLPYRMKLLVQLLSRRFQDALTPYDLTPLHWGILCCLWRQDGLATHAIAKELEQLGGTVTVALDAMERRGILRRQHDEQDRRISRLWLTDEGRRLKNDLVPMAERLANDLFSEFTAEEFDKLSAMTDRLYKHVNR